MLCGSLLRAAGCISKSCGVVLRTCNAPVSLPCLSLRGPCASRFLPANLDCLMPREFARFGQILARAESLGTAGVSAQEPWSSPCEHHPAPPAERGDLHLQANSWMGPKPCHRGKGAARQRLSGNPLQKQKARQCMPGNLRNCEMCCSSGTPFFLFFFLFWDFKGVCLFWGGGVPLSGLLVANQKENNTIFPLNKTTPKGKPPTCGCVFASSSGIPCFCFPLRGLIRKP